MNNIAQIKLNLKYCFIHVDKLSVKDCLRSTGKSASHAISLQQGGKTCHNVPLHLPGAGDILRQVWQLGYHPPFSQFFHIQGQCLGYPGSFCLLYVEMLLRWWLSQQTTTTMKDDWWHHVVLKVPFEQVDTNPCSSIHHNGVVRTVHVVIRCSHVSGHSLVVHCHWRRVSVRAEMHLHLFDFTNTRL